ncbi:homeobox protein GBX-2-like [Mesocricetus auratus]|uniref:Homeobox protein GBX-2-like n=1 Tax=Mesocricetus auratus TaxID=10036 RepID=A0ABM2Y8X8_MESAU|nr:homeobox protein GBX-2-like [Mesocricetus auratus]XP_040611272.1 homeobox protein GBX-2-like [Mesocricetus auratus]
MLESPPPPPPPSLPPSPSPHPPPPPLPLPTAPGLRHSRLYDITFLTPSGARSTAGTLLLGPGRFAAASDAAEFELGRQGKSFAQTLGFPQPTRTGSDSSWVELQLDREGGEKFRSQESSMSNRLHGARLTSSSSPSSPAVTLPTPPCRVLGWPVDQRKLVVTSLLQFNQILQPGPGNA